MSNKLEDILVDLETGEHIGDIFWAKTEILKLFRGLLPEKVKGPSVTCSALHLEEILSELCDGLIHQTEDKCEDCLSAKSKILALFRELIPAREQFIEDDVPSGWDSCLEEIESRLSELEEVK